MKPTTLLWCAAVVAACANVTSPNSEQEARLAEARALLATDPARAVDVAESLLHENKNLRAARLVAAEGSMRLAESGKGQASLHLHDAAANFDRALANVADADEPQALMMLADCRFRLGEYPAAQVAALRAATGFAGVDLPDERKEAAAAWLLAGRCDVQQLDEARRAERAGGTPDRSGRVPIGRNVLELASLATARLQMAQRELPVDAAIQLAIVHRCLEQPGEALRDLERGMRAAPQETAIHEAYMKAMIDRRDYDALVGAYAQFVRENPGTPILRYHQGRAICTLGDKLRHEGNFAKAIAAYEKAEHAFGEYEAMVPAHADAANQWRATCDLAIARCAIDTGDLRLAETRLLDAGSVSPAATAYTDGKPQLVDNLGNHFLGCVAALDAALAESGGDALARVLAFDEHLLQQFPDRWAFVYANAALAARDLGVRIAATDPAAAKDLWERSYRCYEKAVALSPDDARTANDCGLMLVYHLDRDFDRARALFDRAIELGKQQLAALPADAPVRDRENLEQAVGDALQNIAVLLRDHRHAPAAEWTPFCTEAVKFYPYERREAAAMLRERDAAHEEAQGGAAEALASRRTAIDEKVKAEDFDGALTELDAIGKQCKDHAPFQLRKGEITLQLAAQARASGRKGADLFYQDAVASLQRAVELDGAAAAPRQLLAEAQYQSGDSEGASRTLSALLLHLQSQGGGKPEELLALHTLRAHTAASAYAAKKQANEDDKELLAAARASFRLLEEKGKLDDDTRGLWSTTERWAAANAEAVNVYVRALQKTPDDGKLLDTLLRVGYELGQMQLAVDALAKRSDGLGLYYLGEARFWLADAQASGGKGPDALKTLDAAREAFAAASQKKPEFRDSCEARIARCLGKKGCIALNADDAANAEKWLLEAARARPAEIGADLGGQESIKRSLLFLVDKFMKKNDLAKVEAIARAAAAAADKDVDLLNNAGLFARDWGNQLERRGKQTEAKEMYEQSYKAYRRAQELDPGNVRLRNDCALIAIYHLDRDWDLTKKMLDSAIEDGEKMLRDNPPADANDKQQLDEAVGDCLENLALWYLKHSKDGAAAKAAAERSLQHHPGERRGGAQRHLQEAERLLQGK
jgi:hypothetical protein